MKPSRSRTSRFCHAIVLVALAQTAMACTSSLAGEPATAPQVTVLDLEPSTIRVSDGSEVREGAVRLELNATTIVVPDDGWSDSDRAAAASVSSYGAISRTLNHL